MCASQQKHTFSVGGRGRLWDKRRRPSVGEVGENKRRGRLCVVPCGQSDHENLYNAFDSVTESSSQPLFIFLFALFLALNERFFLISIHTWFNFRIYIFNNYNYCRKQDFFFMSYKTKLFIDKQLVWLMVSQEKSEMGAKIYKKTLLTLNLLHIDWSNP